MGTKLNQDLIDLEDSFENEGVANSSETIDNDSLIDWSDSSEDQDTENSSQENFDEEDSDDGFIDWGDDTDVSDLPDADSIELEEGDSETEEVEEDPIKSLSDEELDEEIEAINSLLDIIEDENESSNPDEDIISETLNEARLKISEIEQEKEYLARRNQKLEEMIMQYGDKDIETSLNRPFIDKISSDVSLKQIVNLSGREDESSKGKLADLLLEKYKELTGVDPFEGDTSTKLRGLTSKNSTSAPEIKEEPEEDHYGYEESIRNIF